MALTEIIPGKLYQSGMFEAAEAEIRKDFTIFVNCCRAAIPPREGCALISFPFDDEPKLPDLARLHWVAGKVANVVKFGERCLVSCAGGHNRSGLVIGLALVKLGVVPTGKEAVAYVRQRNPAALNNAVFAAYLEAL